MLVFSAIVPHPPILIPGIGKENLNALKKTVRAMEILEEEFCLAAVETAVVISPHGDINFDAFTVNTSESYTAQFHNFGDFGTKLKFSADLEFINRLKGMYESKLPIQLISQDNLDHGCSVPLYYLTRKSPKTKIVPVYYSYLNYQKHLEFGAAIKEAVYSLDKRCAIISSGDLSHRLSINAPAGFSPRAKEFDKKIIQLLKKKNIDGILQIDSALIEDAGECGLRSILVLLGAIREMNYNFEILSYESPFGVGYLVAQAKLA